MGDIVRYQRIKRDDINGLSDSTKGSKNSRHVLLLKNLR